MSNSANNLPWNERSCCSIEFATPLYKTYILITISRGGKYQYHWIIGRWDRIVVDYRIVFVKVESFCQILKGILWSMDRNVRPGHLIDNI